MKMKRRGVRGRTRGEGARHCYYGSGGGRALIAEGFCPHYILPDSSIACASHLTHFFFCLLCLNHLFLLQTEDKDEEEGGTGEDEGRRCNALLLREWWWSGGRWTGD